MKIKNRRRSSIMQQIVENARMSFILDVKHKNTSNQQPQTPKKYPSIYSIDEEISVKQSSPKDSSISQTQIQSMSHLDALPQYKISTQELLRDLRIITPVQNIFNRLRVSRNSNKITREATQIIDKFQQKTIKNKDLKNENIEFKLPNLLKTFGNIMVDLLKFIKKNNSLNFPHFHSFTFDNFINNYGYSQSTEKKFYNLVKSCYYFKGQHTRVNMYYKLLVGEIDYIDYKFLIEIIQKIDDSNQQGIGVVSNTSDSLIGWSKVYEFFMQYFGQVIAVKSYQEYERQLQQMKQKHQQSNKIMINVDDAIELLMKIYQSEMKQSFCLNYIDLFTIIDIYDCNFLTLDQFFVLYYSIEPEKDHLSKSQLTQIFMQEHDLQLSMADSTKLEALFDDALALQNSFTHIQLVEYGIQKDFIYGLSIYRFCQICIDYEFLSLSKQSQFLGMGIEIQLSQLLVDFDEKISVIQKRLAYSGKYNIQYHLQFKALKNYILMECDDKFTPFFSDKKFDNSKQALITYKFLDFMSKQHYTNYIIEQDLLPPSLMQIQNVYQTTDSKFKNKKIRSQ